MTRRDRRHFLQVGTAGVAAVLAGCAGAGTRTEEETASAEEGKIAAPLKGPVIISTWDHGMAANKKAWEVLHGGGSVLDAVEQGVGVVESDFTNRSVGLGGTARSRRAYHARCLHPGSRQPRRIGGLRAAFRAPGSASPAR